MSNCSRYWRGDAAGNACARDSPQRPSAGSRTPEVKCQPPKRGVEREKEEMGHRGQAERAAQEGCRGQGPENERFTPGVRGVQAGEGGIGEIEQQEGQQRIRSQCDLPPRPVARCQSCFEEFSARKVRFKTGAVNQAVYERKFRRSSGLNRVQQASISFPHLIET